jgi:hypothetical protein
MSEPTKDPERIYLQPECCAAPETGRLWCNHDAPVDCEEGVAWTDYVRADVASLDAAVAQFLPWADATFPEATSASCIAHLASEVEELKEFPGHPEELADAFMLIVHAAHRAGVDLADAVLRKLAKNRRREWGPTNEQGFREHVRFPITPEAGDG